MKTLCDSCSVSAGALSRAMWSGIETAILEDMDLFATTAKCRPTMPYGLSMGASLRVVFSLLSIRVNKETDR